MNKPSEHWLYVSVVVTVSDVSGYSITTCNFAEGQLHEAHLEHARRFDVCILKMMPDSWRKHRLLLQYTLGNWNPCISHLFAMK